MKRSALIMAAGAALALPAVLMVLSLNLSPVHAEAGAHALYDGYYGESETCFIKPHSASNNAQTRFGRGNAYGSDMGATVSVHSLTSDMSGACNVCGQYLQDWRETKVHPLLGDDIIECDA